MLEWQRVSSPYYWWPILGNIGVVNLQTYGDPMKDSARHVP